MTHSVSGSGIEPSSPGSITGMAPPLRQCRNAVDGEWKSPYQTKVPLEPPSISDLEGPVVGQTLVWLSRPERAERSRALTAAVRDGWDEARVRAVLMTINPVQPGLFY